MTRVLIVVAASVVTAVTAFAQAPGEWTPPPQPAPVVVAPVAYALRWSVGLNVGFVDLTTTDRSGEEASFEVRSLAFRYRPWDHVELELELGSGDELDDPYSSEYFFVRPDLAMSFGALSARYRFHPQNRWNYWLGAGVGVMTIAATTASDDDLSAARRPLLTFGGGVEYRLRHLAFGVQLGGAVLGKTNELMELELEDRPGHRVGYGSGVRARGVRFQLGVSCYF